ncbi:metallophosphoesterase [Flavilitoribacter nigricans]|uniref:Serine/threonine protein phosphatase n=1 Tax=Flavilitoribacter nigricans (strain ATCC 23147 / DSM 23189 / NBRC 102662 / NCIMB 1420 / SS-2) TaxID=1122177 RepID=A0A2D0MWQ6_FLAN2|nr:metallophosphoesterase [Flavilitoribacter nigricans]PHN00694.1 serine/threonine protein phosphatase [Flavilitoribacter nigricans DSM 23189 = NBRC 102662]
MTNGSTINKPENGRRYAVGDIHGCAKTFEALLWEKLSLQKSDQLFLLGDYIDKGPDNKKVLDIILALQAEGYTIFALKGNHEYFLETDVAYSRQPGNWHKLNDLLEAQDLINAEGSIDQRYLDFVHDLPYYFILDNYVLVHAGLNFDQPDPFSDTESMLYIRGYRVDRSRIGNRIIVHGHTPIGIDEIRSGLDRRERTGTINLDNGCVFDYAPDPTKTGDLGRLCALDLDALELIIQPCLEKNSSDQNKG